MSKMLKITNKDDLKKIIKLINKTYLNLTSLFYKNKETTMNFGKLHLDDAIKSNRFINESVNYIKFMSKNSLNDDMISLQKMHIQSRVKALNSLHEKMYQYISDPKIKGKVIINKSINDLVGVRILVEGLNDNKDDYLDYLKKLKLNSINNIYRPYIKDKGNSNYLAIHLYLKDSNKHFPWEIQLWDPKSEKDNYSEHGKHESNRNTY